MTARPRIVLISRVVADLGRAEAFYRDGLGFTLVGRSRIRRRGWAGRRALMRLGAETVALECFDRPGAPYPPDSRSDDLWFQHLAIVVADMAAAIGVLRGQCPRPISQGGPQVLPLRNGGVSAFKFRDPDGHPLELIQFPPGQGREVWRRRAAVAGRVFLGIDHSALAVASTAGSVRFYRRLGFHVASRSCNHGPAQARLDGLAGARVRVTGLRGAPGGPGLELLAYQPPGRPAPAWRVNGIAADQVTLVRPGCPRARRTLRDPEGHRLVVTGLTPPRAGPPRPSCR